MLAIGLFIGSGPAAAQELATLHGEVLDVATNAPVEGAVVVVGSGNSVAMTDDHGYFRITDVRLGPARISVYRIGYRTLEQVATRVEEGTILQVFLTPEAIPIEGVVATVESPETEERRRSGDPISVMSPAEVDAVRHRVGSSLDVIRMMGPPRLHLRQTASSGNSLVEYCISTTRIPPTLRARRDDAVGGCQQALLMIDGVIIFHPLVSLPGRVGKFLQADAADRILNVPAEDIESVRYLSPMEARFRFGEAGKFGALMIETRRGGRHLP